METSVLLGKDKATGKKVWLSSRARRLGNYVVGVQGMGKSNILEQIALQDIANGEGVCVITPHPELIQDILESIPENRWDDVIVFSPGDDCPIGLNVFEWAGPGSGIPIEKIADDVVTETFKQLWEDSWGDRMAEMMSNVARTILLCQSLPLEHRPTLAEFAKIVGRGKETKYRSFLLQHIEQSSHSLNKTASDEVFAYWKWFDEQDKRFREEIASSTLNKARMFRANEMLAHVVGQPVNKVNLQDVMDEGKILLVDLDVNRLGRGNVEIVGSLLVGRLLLAALGRTGKRLPVFTGAGMIPEPPITEDDTQTGKGKVPLRLFHIIADEFAYFATPAFAELQDQTRKYGVDVLVAHQRRGQLTEETKDATLTARNWIVFSVNSEDAEVLSGGFDSTPPEPEVKGEREPLGYASYPWDALKRQSHDKKEINDLVHGLDSSWFMAVGNRGLNVSSDISGLEKLALDEFIPNDEKFLQEWSKIVIPVFPSEQRRSEFEKSLNIVLYKMMKSYPLVDYCNILFSMSNLLFSQALNILEHYETGAQHSQIVSVDGGDPRFSTSLLKEKIPEDAKQLLGDLFNVVSNILIAEFEAAATELRVALAERKTLEQEGYKQGFKDNRISKWMRYVDKEREEQDRKLEDQIYEAGQRIPILRGKLTGLRHTYARVCLRLWVLTKIVELGKLLQQYPVWVRGGQPITEYEPLRSHGDVTKEWKNRFAHLEQYEAWVRVQEGRELKEYNIKTLKAQKPKDRDEAFENASRIRSLSQRKYGVCRAEIEQMLRERLALPEIEGADQGTPMSDPAE